MKTILTAMIACGLVCGTPMVAHADPCAKDRETLCAGVKAGGGRFMKCLRENEAKVSAECKASWEKHKGQRRDAMAACHEDAKKHCADKKRRDLMKCLHDKKDQLSATCQGELKELKEAREERREERRADKREKKK